jgi:potassium-transporting ATPase KdpC subunit
MMRTAIIALRVTFVTMMLTGLVYPLAITGLAQVLFGHRADGSLVTGDRGSVIGSELIGQRFTHPAYVHGRLSAAGENGWDASASSGSNLGPTSQPLRERILLDVTRLRADNPDASGPVPAELLTASGSGLDPHVSPETALWQAPRIAASRGVTTDRVRAAIDDAVQSRALGILGEPRVNVLLVNLALDRTFGRPDVR